MSITGNWDRRISRRRFLAMSGMGTAALMLGASGRALAQSAPSEYPSTLGNPFTIGVASGDPLPDGVVLWTRLAPSPLNGGGINKKQGDIWVDWEIAKDQNFSDVVLSSTRDTSYATKRPRAIAEKNFAHSVHLEVTGLAPNTTYYYRFKVRKRSDGTYAYDSWDVGHKGRAKTTPAADWVPAAGSAMTLALASCQSWQGGFYQAYRDIANQNLDCVIHLGDYIYEYAPPSNSTGYPRVYKTSAPSNLTGYRNRHAEHKTDPDLQAAHAKHPWVVTWDDHEVYNGYSGGYSGDQNTRRDAAYQAYYEHMPIRPSVLARRTDGTVNWRNVNLYRRVAYGQLAQFCMLDTRQYRHNQVSCSGVSSELVDQYDSCYNDRFSGTDARTMTGGAQEQWLKEKLTPSAGHTWNVLANQVIMFEYDHDWPDRSYESYYVDAWDGYAATRDSILRHLYESETPNPIVLTGDMHCSWVADLKVNPDPNKWKTAFKESDSVNVGTEFTGTSISSYLSGGWKDTYYGALGSNPHVGHYDDVQGGYMLCTLTPERWQTELRVARNYEKNDTASREVYSRATFEVQNGVPGAMKTSSDPIKYSRS